MFSSAPSTSSTSPAIAPSRSVRLILFGMVNALYAVSVMVWWISNRYLSDRWWPATFLLYAPRWIAFIPMLLLMPLAYRWRRQRILTLLIGLFVLGPLMGFNIPWRGLTTSTPQGQKIRLLTCNVHRLELDVNQFDEYLLEAQPDVIVLQDYSGWDDIPSLRAGWHNYRVGEIYIASKFPIRQVIDIGLDELKDPGSPRPPRRAGAAARFDLQTPAGIVHLFNIHLASPHTALTDVLSTPRLGGRRVRYNSLRRHTESVEVRRQVGQITGPFIIAGDFNTLAESPLYREQWSGYPDAFPTLGWGYGFTHFTIGSELRLDHVLTGNGIAPASYIIGPACGTPHRPFVVDLVVKGS
jgi:endonuclease/exonuclease/phosphatase (EEP) superfamily protein YafD